MTDEQTRKLAALQTSYLESLAQMRKARTITERDSAILASQERFMAETDGDVKEAFTLWMVRRLKVGEVTIAWPDGTETTESFTVH